MDKGPKVGQTHEESIEVTEELLALRFVRGTPSAYATPALVGLIERVAAEYMRPFLEPGQTSVGTKIELQHKAPTPAGMSVRCEVKLEEFNGPKYTFSVLAWDEKEQIAEAHHVRFVVDQVKFESRLESKSGT